MRRNIFSPRPISCRMNEQELWQKVLTSIELQISKANFVTWFKSTYVSSWKNSVVSVAVPNGFTKEWLDNKYNKFILKALREVTSEIKEVRYVIENKKITLQENREEEDVVGLQESQLAFEEFETDKNTNLNPKYTFSSFVVGPSNELAHAAALAIVKKPGVTYNPLFLYGGVGLGKTHLLQAVGNSLADSQKVIYVTSEQFTNEFISSIQNRSVEAFKNKYRKKDVLIIDDVQFIAGKEQTQEEFFHTFNALHEQNKQIILSSDKPPKAIPTLEERLCSRFEGGMMVDVGYPEFETRVAILKSKLKEKNVSLEKEVVEYIAQNIKKNIRELEGALNLVVASSQLHKNEVSLEQVKKSLSHIIEQPKKPLNYIKVFKVVSGFYEIPEKELLGKNRRQEVVLPRQVAMYLMREELKGSYPFIGDKFGGRDHTTVIHAYVKISKKIKQNSEFEEEISLIKQQLYSE